MAMNKNFKHMHHENVKRATLASYKNNLSQHLIKHSKNWHECSVKTIIVLMRFLLFLDISKDIIRFEVVVILKVCSSICFSIFNIRKDTHSVVTITRRLSRYNPVAR